MAAVAFLSSLPDELCTDEVALVGVLARAGAIAARFLPPSVTLQAWAEKRIPDHLIEKVNASGVVHVARDAPPQPRPPPSPPPQQTPQGQPSSSIGLRSGSGKRVKIDFDIAHFLSSLPNDELAPEEVALREELIVHLERKRVKAVRRRTNTAVRLSDVQRFEGMNVPLATLQLPMEYLLDWISARIGSDIEISYDDQESALLKVTKETRDFFAQENQTFAEQYLSSLPREEFTPEELTLRDTLFAYLETWHKSSTVPPTLAIMCQDPVVWRAKHDAMPSRLALRLWIEARLGQELELAEAPTGQIAVGFLGQLPKHAVERMQKFSKATSLIRHPPPSSVVAHENNSKQFKTTRKQLKTTRKHRK